MCHSSAACQFLSAPCFITLPTLKIEDGSPHLTTLLIPDGRRFLVLASTGPVPGCEQFTATGKSGQPVILPGNDTELVPAPAYGPNLINVQISNFCCFLDLI